MHKHPNIFISGPMTGLPDFNLHEFCDKHARLKKAGAGHIYNPALSWLTEPEHVSKTRDHQSYMQECIREMLREDEYGQLFYDFVAQLVGWQASPGAMVESTTAEAIGIKALPVDQVITLLKKHDPEANIE